MAVPIVDGVATGKWKEFKYGTSKPASKAELLILWDLQTAELNEKFRRFRRTASAKWTRHSASGRGRESQPSSTPSTTRFIIAARDTCICARSASSRRTSGSGTKDSLGIGCHAASHS